MPHRRPRVLALDPAPRGIAFVALEGRDYLLDWGIPTLKTRHTKEAVQKTKVLLDRFRPNLLVFEHVDGSRRGRRARKILTKLTEEAELADLPVVEVSRAQVREHFADTDGTKYEIALALADRFPELEPRLPRKREPWMSEDARMNIFDALSFATTALAANWPQFE